MKASEEFVVGKHGIGWVDYDFKSRYGSESFEPVATLGTYQTLPRYMSDKAIESELKPGICTLGDVLALLEGAPQESKDGNWNIFYVGAFVVGVRWIDVAWYVGTWHRGDSVWYAGVRVFSPATGAQDLVAGPSDSLTLEARVRALEEWQQRVQQS